MANRFDPTARISPLARVDVSTRGTDTIIGAASVLDDFVKIKHVGGTGHVEIGSRVYINSGCVLYSGNGIKIGDDVLIGPNCNLVPTNHNFDASDRPIADQGFMPSKGGVVIEDDVWLGAGVTLADGALVRKGAVVGANALVLGEVPAFSIVGGVPAIQIGSRQR